MRTAVRICALVIALGVLGFWLLRGADRGWTKTSIRVKRVDPITEIEVDDFKPSFVPGVDFLVGGLFVAGLLGGSSFFFQKARQTAG